VRPVRGRLRHSGGGEGGRLELLPNEGIRAGRCHGPVGAFLVVLPVLAVLAVLAVFPVLVVLAVLVIFPVFRVLGVLGVLAVFGVLEVLAILGVLAVLGVLVPLLAPPPLSLGLLRLGEDPALLRGCPQPACDITPFGSR
jgi:hypothetical protein